MTKSYSQYGEDLIIEKFFNGKVGNLLDLGANDGITFSNSKLFIDKGWGGVLIEASPITFKKLNDLYIDNKNVLCVEKCLSDIKKTATFYHNVYHSNETIGDNKDLLSTIDYESFQRTYNWGTFTNFDIECDTLTSVLDTLGEIKFDYVSIDIEGMDLQILEQIDLDKYGVQLLVIEHNNVIKNEVIEYCKKFGLTNILFENNVNIILHR